MEKKLSVVVPVYNAEKTINKCVQSLFDQTYKNLEIILVNDGSKDQSLSVIKDIASKNENVIVIDKENGGAASARNRGIKEATGEYIGFCDADDYFDSDTFKTLIDIMEEKNLPTIECLSKVFNSDGKLLVKDIDDRDLYRKDFRTAIKDIFLRTGNVSLSTRITKADAIKNISIPEGRRVEDFYFTIKLLSLTNGTAIYNYPFYSCVVSKGSVTRSGGGSIYMDAIYFFDKAKEFIKPLNLDLALEEEYYLFKMYYLLAISLTSKERKLFKSDVKAIKKNIKLNRAKIKNNPYLKRKEKIILSLAKTSFSLTRLFYLIKGGK